MKKVKVRGEYFIDLLHKIKDSKRYERKEEGFELVEKSPEWATKENLWTYGTYDKKIEGWEKLCIEAYLCGWIDYFDIRVAGVPDDGDEARTIYFDWKHTSLEVYLKPGSKPLPAPPPPPVPKPPPPPLG